MEAKFILIIVNVVVAIVLALFARFLDKKVTKLSKRGVIISVSLGVAALLYAFISYGYLLSIYPQPEYFWQGTLFLYPISLLSVGLFVLQVFCEVGEKSKWGEELGNTFFDDDDSGDKK
ncbi:MAG: hypothetical protein ACK5N8_00680 [Alphaproteobacteria bacterium]